MVKPYGAPTVTSNREIRLAAHHRSPFLAADASTHVAKVGEDYVLKAAMIATWDWGLEAVSEGVARLKAGESARRR